MVHRKGAAGKGDAGPTVVNGIVRQGKQSTVEKGTIVIILSLVRLELGGRRLTLLFRGGSHPLHASITSDCRSILRQPMGSASVEFRALSVVN